MDGHYSDQQICKRMISDAMQLSRALVSISQKIGTANAPGSSMPQWMRVASQADILNLHSVEEGREDDGEMLSSEIVSDHWLTMFDRSRVIEAMADRETFARIETATGKKRVPIGMRVRMALF